jgi:glucan 1,3-beta-glucosidase
MSKNEDIEDGFEDVSVDAESEANRGPSPPPRGAGLPLFIACALICPLAIALVVFASLLGRASISAPIFTPLVAANSSGPVMDGVQMMRGVNLGGWLVLEPWITPSLFYQFLDRDVPAKDERTFCKMLGSDEARAQLAAFREAWVTEETFVRLRSIGINTVRLPYGYWLFGDRPEFCPGVSSVEYIDKAVGWAEKHNLRLVLDLHGVPGSQNGFDNSGDSHKPPFGSDLDAHDWLLEKNADIAIDILSRVARRYADSAAVVQMGLVNEPIGFALSGFCKANCPIDQIKLIAYYERAWAAVRANNQHVTPVLDVSFRNHAWAPLREPGKPWVEAGAVLDSHRYHGWWPRGSAVPQIAHLRRAACDARRDIEEMEAEALPTVIGEWSLAVSDCMTFLNGVGLDAAMTSPSECGRVPCPETFGKLPLYVTKRNGTADGVPAPARRLPLGSHGGPDADGMCPVDPLSAPPGPLSYDAFYTLFAAYAIRGYEGSRGWTFWNFKSEVADPRWGFLDMYDAGWLPKTLDGWNPPVAECDAADAGGMNWHELFTATVVCAVLLALALLVALGAWCGCFRCCARDRGFVKMQTMASDLGAHGVVELSTVSSSSAPPVRSRIAAGLPHSSEDESRGKEPLPA